jgi:CHAT domain-containing protein
LLTSYVAAEPQQKTRGRFADSASPSQTRKPWRSLLVSLAALLILLPLTDRNPVSAQVEFDQARQLLLHGYPALSQEKAEDGYKRFLHSEPEWAARFQLLEAEDMEWRGMYGEARRALAAPMPGQGPPGTEIQRLSIESVALIHLEDPSADRMLASAENLCSHSADAACGDVIRARGLLAMERGKFSDARELFLSSLRSAREHSNLDLETSALSNLGVAMLQLERYDEALDWLQSARRSALSSGDANLEQAILGNLGEAYLELGDIDRALGLFFEAEKKANDIGNIRARIRWLSEAGNAYQVSENPDRAAQSYRKALDLATQLDNRQEIINSLENLAHVSIDAGRLDEADTYVSQVAPLVKETQGRLDDLDVMLAQGKIAAARHQDQQARDLFRAVEKDRDSQTSMRLGAEHQLARLFEAEGDVKNADNMYRTALTTFEAARSELKTESSKLPFLNNATPIYDDYIHFLVTQGKAGDALNIADQSRARTLSQGLGVASGAGRPLTRAALRPAEIARKAGATLLFYWLGRKQSYLWAITPQKATVFLLPPQAQIAQLAGRYRRSLLGPEDPLFAASEDGRALYDILVAPAASLIRTSQPVILLTDGALSQLNFETLQAPGPSPFGTANEVDAPAHYWIENATLISAPSLSMVAAAAPSRTEEGKLLMFGDAVSPDQDYPELPMASLEMHEIQKHFPARERAVFTRQQANPTAYLANVSGRYSYIHFVTHGVASLTDPLDSAIILSRTGAGEDSFKLHAREIIQHPIDARLVTISACYGSGARSYAGEGLVGLSWAFLRAGAHNVIAALWEASDESTPQLMDSLYQGLEDGMEPGDALRYAKLSLMHSRRKNYSKPFFWAAFQIYTGH